MVFQTIEWHIEGNKNVKIYLNRKIEKLRELAKEVNKTERDWLFKDKQIAHAIVLGKKKFDDEKFLYKKRDALHAKGEQNE